MGTVTNWISPRPIPLTLVARSCIVPSPNSGSVVSDFVAASRKEKSFVGWASSLVDVASCMTDDRNACWRSIRPRSEPSPTDLRTRTYWRAWRPSRVCRPAVSSRWVFLSLIASFVQTSTPPSASTIVLNPRKSTTA